MFESQQKVNLSLLNQNHGSTLHNHAFGKQYDLGIDLIELGTFQIATAC